MPHIFDLLIAMVKGPPHYHALLGKSEKRNLLAGRIIGPGQE
jgi:hypothetical protein